VFGDRSLAFDYLAVIHEFEAMLRTLKPGEQWMSGEFFGYTGKGSTAINSAIPGEVTRKALDLVRKTDAIYLSTSKRSAFAGSIVLKSRCFQRNRGSRHCRLSVKRPRRSGALSVNFGGRPGQKLARSSRTR